MKVSELMDPKGVLLHAKIDNSADALGILVELQEGIGVITNGNAYYNAVSYRETFGAGYIGPALAPRCGLGCPGRGTGRPCVYDRRSAALRKPAPTDSGTAGEFAQPQ